MNPEEHLQRTRAPEPPPFLRHSVLRAAESAWQEGSTRRRIPRIAFSPLTAAACVLVAFAVALLVSEIDRRMTASLVPELPPAQTVRDPARFAAEQRAYRLAGDPSANEIIEEFAWYRVGASRQAGR